MSFLLPTRWPLVPLDVAAFFLNRPPEALARDCDSLWAWDISATSKRRQLRLWRNSLIAMKDPVARRDLAVGIDQVIDSFLPPRNLSGREVQHLLFCHRHLIQDLAAAGVLEIEHERRTATGPTGSRVYSHTSVRRFLVDRVMGEPLLRKIPPAAPFHPDARN